MRSTTKLGFAFDYAAAHHHLLPTEVMRAAGLQPGQIRALAHDRVIERIIRGLYRVAGSRSPLQDIAATLHRHGGATASHTSALYVHGFDVAPPPEPLFTLPPGSTSRTRLGILHRSPLAEVDTTRRQRLPVTTVARSLVDAAEVMSVDELAAVVNEAITRRMVIVPHIIEAAGRAEQAPGRLGSGRLRQVLATWTDEIRPDSVAEAAAIRRIVSFGLPAPVTQHVIEDDGEFVARVDLAWPDARVIREYQSVQWHRPDRIEADEIRLQRLESLGWSVDPLFRYHLLSGEIAWLERLRDQVGRRGRAAS